MSQTDQRSIHDAVAALHAAGITVAFTKHPVIPTSRQADGCVLAVVGLLTITRTGRAFAELYDSTDHVRVSMLDHLERDVVEARQAGCTVIELRCWLRPETVAEMHAWSMVRESLLR